MELKYKHLYKTVLKEYQNLSKCARLKVAALLVNDGRILSCGYNGTPTGKTNCNELFKTEDGKFYYKNFPDEQWTETTEKDWMTRHHEFAEYNEIHAEMSAIGYALKNKIDISNASMVLSHEPCENCAKLIYSANIKHIMYVNEYDRGSNGLQFLEKNGIIIEKL